MKHLDENFTKDQNNIILGDLNITPEDIELDKLELQEESNLDSHSQKN